MMTDVFLMSQENVHIPFDASLRDAVDETSELKYQYYSFDSFAAALRLRKEQQ
jgi:hypothetical protein